MLSVLYCTIDRIHDGTFPRLIILDVFLQQGHMFEEKCVGLFHLGCHVLHDPQVVNQDTVLC